jgi:hypothetical protein
VLCRGNLLQLLDRADAFIRRQPRVSGSYEQILGRSLEQLVNRAEELKRKWQVGGRAWMPQFVWRPWVMLSAIGPGQQASTAMLPT